MRKQIADTSNSLKYDKIYEHNHKNRSKVPIFDVVYVLEQEKEAEGQEE